MAQQRPLPELPASAAAFHGANAFSDAHHFTLNNPTFYDVRHSIYGESGVHSALQHLARFSLKGSDHDSSQRDSAPRCHTGTRVELLQSLQAHREKDVPTERIIWLHGVPGAGKSAIMQTMVEYEVELEQSPVGAAVFLSRRYGRHDPSRLITTIAYSLAVKSPAYLAYITQRLSGDPKLVEKTMAEQFRHFIQIPFAEVQTWIEPNLSIYVDALDELKSENHQCRFLELICKFAKSFPNAPLVWIISSRSEERVRDILAQYSEGSMWHEIKIEPIQEFLTAIDPNHNSRPRGPRPSTVDPKRQRKISGANRPYTKNLHVQYTQTSDEAETKYNQLVALFTRASTILSDLSQNQGENEMLLSRFADYFRRPSHQHWHTLSPQNAQHPSPPKTPGLDAVNSSLLELTRQVQSLLHVSRPLPEPPIRQGYGGETLNPPVPAFPMQSPLPNPNLVPSPIPPGLSLHQTQGLRRSTLNVFPALSSETVSNLTVPIAQRAQMPGPKSVISSSGPVTAEDELATGACEQHDTPGDDLSDA